MNSNRTEIEADNKEVSSVERHVRIQRGIDFVDTMLEGNSILRPESYEDRSRRCILTGTRPISGLRRFEMNIIRRFFKRYKFIQTSKLEWQCNETAAGNKT